MTVSKFSNVSNVYLHYWLHLEITDEDYSVYFSLSYCWFLNSFYVYADFKCFWCTLVQFHAWLKKNTVTAFGRTLLTHVTVIPDGRKTPAAIHLDGFHCHLIPGIMTHGSICLPVAWAGVPVLSFIRMSVISLKVCAFILIIYAVWFIIFHDSLIHMIHYYSLFMSLFLCI